MSHQSHLLSIAGNFRIASVCLTLGISSLFAQHSLSQQADPDISKMVDDYQKLNVDYQVDALTPNLMGDKLDVSSGTTKFEYVDIDIPGDSDLAVELPRSRNTTGRGGIYATQASAFHLGSNHDWHFDTPKLSFEFVTDERDFPSRYLPAAIETVNFCSDSFYSNFFSVPLPRQTPVLMGYKLIVPGQVNEHLIKNTNALPGANDADYVTKSKWKVRCTGPNGNESFEASSPQGVKYIFDIKHVSGVVGLWGAFEWETSEHMIFASRVEDRFGNWVQYSYNNGELSSISSNDGRLITIARTSDGANVTANGRTWQYSNFGNRVDLPDGRYWEYSFYEDDTKTELNGWHAWRRWVSSGDGRRNDRCALSDGTEGYGSFVAKFNNRAYTPGSSIGASSSTIGTSHLNQFPYQQAANEPHGQYIEIRHPDGAIGKFWVGLSLQGQTKVLPDGHYVGSFQEVHAENGRCTSQPSLIKKAIEYANGSEYAWHYQHSNNWGAWDPAYTPANGAESNILNANTIALDHPYALVSSSVHLPSNVDNYNYKVLKIIQPDASYVMHYINRDYQSDWQDSIAATAYFDSAHNLLKEERWSYSPGTEWGTTPDEIVYNSQTQRVQFASPKQIAKQTILFDSAGQATNYFQNYSNFDSYDVAQDISQHNDIPQVHSRYLRQEYYNDTANWLLSQPLRTYVEASAITSTSGLTPAIENVYHTSGSYSGLSLVHQERRFGRWIKRHQSYHDDGNVLRTEYNQQLRNSAGALTSAYRYIDKTSYKRGKPQLFTYPARYSNTRTITQSQSVDDNGWITRIADFNGNTTGYTYNDVGRLVSIDLPTSAANPWLDTLFSWDYSSGTLVLGESRCQLNANKTACSGSELYKETITYDGVLRPVLTHRRDLAASVSRYQNKTFDWKNQSTFESFWSNSSSESEGTDFTYDGLQRRESIETTGLGTRQYQYLLDNKIRVTDAKSHATTSTFLAFGLPAYDQPTKIESPENVDTEFDVDVFGLVQSITQAGPGKSGRTISQIEHHYYDQYRQLCLVTRKDVGSTAYSKNALGENQWTADGLSHNLNNCVSSPPSNATNYLYDNLGAMSAADYSDSSPDVIYVRDNNGNVTSMTADTVTQNYVYNDLDLVDSESLSLGSELSLSLTYGYDRLGARASTTYPDGTLVEYSPNGFGEPKQVQRQAGSGLGTLSYASAVEYHPNGMIKQFNYGNGLAHQTLLNTSRLPERVFDTGGGTTALDYSYQFDNNLNVVQLTDNASTAYSLNNLQYDGLDRLVSASGGSGIGSSSISYDGLGNITYYQSKNSALDYTYDTSLNRLSSVSGTGSASKDYSSFQYDGRGNVTNNSHRSFTFNNANQMVASGANSYVYDGNGKRVKTNDSQGTSYSLFGIDGVLLYRQTGTDGINYVYLGSRLVAKDGVIAENSGKQHYRPYGHSIEGEIDGVGYTGHKYDTDLALSYMEARYYDPVLGRFYSNDPVGFLEHLHSTPDGIQGFNRYAYANNNPYKYTDPTGEAANLTLPFRVGWKIGLGINATIKHLSGGAALGTIIYHAVNGPMAKNQMLVTPRQIL